MLARVLDFLESIRHRVIHEVEIWSETDDRKEWLLRPSSENLEVGADFSLSLLRDKLVKEQCSVFDLRWLLTFGIVTGLALAIIGILALCGILTLFKLQVAFVLSPLLALHVFIGKPLMIYLLIAPLWIGTAFLSVALLITYVFADLRTQFVSISLVFIGSAYLIACLGIWGRKSFRDRSEVIVAATKNYDRFDRQNAFFHAAHGMHIVADALKDFEKSVIVADIIDDAALRFQKMAEYTDGIGIRETDISDQLHSLFQSRIA